MKLYPDKHLFATLRLLTDWAAMLYHRTIAWRNDVLARMSATGGTGHLNEITSASAEHEIVPLPLI